MKLAQEDLNLFFRLYPALLVYANQQLNVVDGVPTLEKFMNSGLEKQVNVRNALYDNIALINSFVTENPFNFSSVELEIVAEWKHLVKGTFYLLH